MMDKPEERDTGAAPSTTMRAITISREYGSGGDEIAARLADRLGWRFIDREVVVEVAHRLGVTENDAAQRDEHAESFMDQILRSFRAVDPTPLSTLGVPEFVISPEAHDYAVALRVVVRAIANAGQAVIIGRGGQAILHTWRDVLHVRIVAPLELRISSISQREGLDHDAAHHRVQKKDHDAQRYLRSIYDLRVEDSTLYDIVLNSAALDLDSCVELIIMALERKARLMPQSSEAISPDAGAHRDAGASIPATQSAYIPSDALENLKPPSAPESQIT